MAKLLKFANDDNRRLFFCPGCKTGHVIVIAGEKAWGWNGSEDVPTFTPSYLVYGWKSENPEFRSQPRCHSFVRDGNIQFLDDCEHELRGQTVPLPDASVLARGGD